MESNLWVLEGSGMPQKSIGYIMYFYSFFLLNVTYFTTHSCKIPSFQIWNILMIYTLLCFSLYNFYSQDSSMMYSTHISYLEIYNEVGYDLLDSRHEASRLEDLPSVFFSNFFMSFFYLVLMCSNVIRASGQTINWAISFNVVVYVFHVLLHFKSLLD